MGRHLGSALTGALAGLTALFGLTAGYAAEFPARPIRLVVPYSAGGPTDVVGRVVADYMARDLKQAAFVENKPGAQGAIGAEAVARSDADGYTLLVVSGSMFTLNPMLYKKLAYDPDRDFRTLAIVTEDPLVMEVHPSVPAKTIAEFVAYARQNPGKLSFSSAGTGGVIHLAGEMFKQMAGIEMTHVPYKGAGPAMVDLLAGNVQLMFDSFGTALPPVTAGLLRALGVSSAERRSEMPNVPTIAESGFPDYLVSVWFSVAVPAKVPDNVAAVLKASLDRAMADETFRASLQKIGYSVKRPQSAAEIIKFIDDDRARWSAVVKARNISLD
jgi:tripartite-type tricarboxylate transporter receptor subunit TctC